MKKEDFYVWVVFGFVVFLAVILKSMSVVFVFFWLAVILNLYFRCRKKK